MVVGSDSLGNRVMMTLVCRFSWGIVLGVDTGVVVGVADPWQMGSEFSSGRLS